MRRMQLLGLGLLTLIVLLLLGSLLSGLGGRDRGLEVTEPQDQSEVRKRVRVEVLNAAGIPGLARTATEQLRERGFDVVFYGNASGFGPDTSVVFDRVGALQNAELVGEALDIREVRTAVDTALFVDVSVILGRDWVESEAASDTVAVQ